MPQELADHGEALAKGQRPRCIRVPYIVRRALWRSGFGGRLRFVGRGDSGQASINGSRARPISAPGVDQDLVDHGDRAVAPDLKHEDLARGGGPARERSDVYLMGNQDNGFRGWQAEQELPEFCRLRVGLVPFPKERVQRGQVLDWTEVEEPGGVAAAAPMAGEDPVDGRAGLRPPLRRRRP